MCHRADMYNHFRNSLDNAMCVAWPPDDQLFWPHSPVLPRINKTLMPVSASERRSSNASFRQTSNLSVLADRIRGDFFDNMTFLYASTRWHLLTEKLRVISTSLTKENSFTTQRNELKPTLKWQQTEISISTRRMSPVTCSVSPFAEIFFYFEQMKRELWPISLENNLFICN